MISTLIFKKGHMRKDGKVTPLKDNQIVEDLLGDQGMVCIEDIVHSLKMADKDSNKILKVLWYYFLYV